MDAAVVLVSKPVGNSRHKDSAEFNQYVAHVDRKPEPHVDWLSGGWALCRPTTSKRQRNGNFLSSESDDNTTIALSL